MTIKLFFRTSGSKKFSPCEFSDEKLKKEHFLQIIVIFKKIYTIPSKKNSNRKLVNL